MKEAEEKPSHVRNITEAFAQALDKFGVSDYVILVNDPDAGDLMRFNGSTFWQRGACLDIADKCEVQATRRWNADMDDDEDEYGIFDKEKE